MAFGDIYYYELDDRELEHGDGLDEFEVEIEKFIDIGESEPILVYLFLIHYADGMKSSLEVNDEKLSYEYNIFDKGCEDTKAFVKKKLIDAKGYVEEAIQVVDDNLDITPKNVGRVARKDLKAGDVYSTDSGHILYVCDGRQNVDGEESIKSLMGRSSTILQSDSVGGYPSILYAVERSHDQEEVYETLNERDRKEVLFDMKERLLERLDYYESMLEKIT